MSKGCATNFVPLLARLVLGFVFIYNGLTKISSQTFDGEKAATLAEITDSELNAEGAFEGKGLHGIALMLDADDQIEWPQPVLLAWVAAITELVGGGLILFGFFSRVWGLGLAITMIVAFYMTSYKAMCDYGDFWKLVQSADDMKAIFMSKGTIGQLGMFVLAFGVFLTGPGAVSIDRLLFPRKGEDDAEAEEA